MDIYLSNLTMTNTQLNDVYINEDDSSYISITTAYLYLKNVTFTNGGYNYSSSIRSQYLYTIQ